MKTNNTTPRRSVGWAVGLLSLLGCTSASAAVAPFITTVAYTSSTPQAQLSWQTPNRPTVSVPKFNPEFGTLKSVEVNMSVAGACDFKIENTEPVARSFSLSIDVSFAGFDGNNVAVFGSADPFDEGPNSIHATTATVSKLLGAFDGNPIGYVGPSAYQQEDLPMSAVGIPLVLAAPANDLSGYIASVAAPNLTYTFSAEAFAIGSGPANPNFEFPSWAQATIVVIYTYETPPLVETPCIPKGVASNSYWESHPDEWPVDSLVLGGVTYNKTQLLAILRASANNDETIALAQELIAAKLNADPSRCNPKDCIDDIIAGADEFLKTHKIGSRYCRSISWTEKLDNYNDGRLCAPKIDCTPKPPPYCAPKPPPYCAPKPPTYCAPKPPTYCAPKPPCAPRYTCYTWRPRR